MKGRMGVGEEGGGWMVREERMIEGGGRKRIEDVG